MIRIKDIAKEAGVSTTTVSNVIHGNTKKVSKETIDKVQELLETYAYVPSMSARTLAVGRSQMVGVLIGGRKETLEHSGFINKVIHELEFQLYKENYYMLLHFSDSPTEILKFALTWAVDGMITIGISVQDNQEIHRRCKMPMVSIDMYNETEDHAANVGTDDFSGGYQMGCFLQEQGHGKIAFLADNDIGVDHYRFQGLAQACGSYGVAVTNKDHIILPRKRQNRHQYYEENMGAWIEKYDALFYASDYYAMEGILFLRDQGYGVPDDISVAGFDDNEFSRLSIPSLTTVHQDVKEKAAAAVSKLIQYLQHEEGILMEEKLPTRIVVRDSVKLNKK